MKRLLIIVLAVIALCVVLAVSPLANGTDDGESGKGEAATAETGGAANATAETGTAEIGGTATVATGTGSEEAGAAEMPAGQKVFTDAKCHLCHTVYSSGIGEPDAEAEDAGASPDLSTAGAGRSAEWMSLYMMKKAAIDEKKHMLSFNGSEEDLAALVDWLLTLRPAEVAAPDEAKVEATGAGETGAGGTEKGE